MKVFKFGGASVKNAEAVINIASILDTYRKEKLVIVVSAMDKTTNAMEELVVSHYSLNKIATDQLKKTKDFHYGIINTLFDKQNNGPVLNRVDLLFKELESILELDPVDNYNYEYAQIVCYGELLSTSIIYEYLVSQNMKADWIDARKIIKTNNDYREAKINWPQTEKNIKKYISPSIDKDKLVITQGFIGSTAERMTSTLGREGSDFTAAILGSVLDAEYVAVWKDVPGILNADPKLFNFAKKMDLVSYKEAIEMTYYGAKVLHPKTIKPLENKGIPLHVMSFIKPADDGTIIRKLDEEPLYPPITIKEPNQIVISIYTTDFSFISESDMSRILLLCSKHKVRVNMMQNKAISMNLCCTNKDYKIEPLINDLKKEFTVINKDKLELLTIRHYNYEIVYELSKSKNIIMEQKSASTYQFVIEP